jgi:hypothetical protein
MCRSSRKNVSHLPPLATNVTLSNHSPFPTTQQNHHTLHHPSNVIFPFPIQQLQNSPSNTAQNLVLYLFANFFSYRYGTTTTIPDSDPMRYIASVRSIRFGTSSDGCGGAGKAFYHAAKELVVTGEIKSAGNFHCGLFYFGLHVDLFVDAVKCVYSDCWYPQISHPGTRVNIRHMRMSQCPCVSRHQPLYCPGCLTHSSTAESTHESAIHTRPADDVARFNIARVMLVLLENAFDFRLRPKRWDRDVIHNDLSMTTSYRVLHNWIWCYTVVHGCTNISSTRISLLGTMCLRSSYSFVVPIPHLQGYASSSATAF